MGDLRSPIHIDSTFKKYVGAGVLVSLLFVGLTKILIKNQGTGNLSCAFFMQKRTALIRKPSLMLSEILLRNKCQCISSNEKFLICRDNVNLCLRLVSGDLLEDSTAEILLSVDVDAEDIEI